MPPASSSPPPPPPPSSQPTPPGVGTTNNSTNKIKIKIKNNNNIVMEAWNRFHDGHEKIKNSVHSYWRQNTFLSPRGTAGKAVMSCVYFSIPVIAGYVLVNEIIDRSESTVHERIRIAIATQSGGANANANVNAEEAQPQPQPQSTETAPIIGAGGWGGGVRLAGSDRATQDVNRINLERFLRKQRKLKEKREREEAAARE